jgi:magnesium-protoporphyrin O-methyltransferase
MGTAAGGGGGGGFGMVRDGKATEQIYSMIRDGKYHDAIAVLQQKQFEFPMSRAALSLLAQRTTGSILFTFAPSTPLLAAMIKLGRLLPRSDRAPWLEPMAEKTLTRLMQQDPVLSAWTGGRTERVSSGFYKSQAMEWSRQ